MTLQDAVIIPLGLNNGLYFTAKWLFSLPGTSNHAYLYSKLKSEGLSERQAFACVSYLQTLISLQIHSNEWLIGEKRNRSVLLRSQT